MDIVVSDNEKIAKMQKTFESIRAEMEDVQLAAYEKAVKNGNEEGAAELARKIRNRLLEESDREVALDRIGLRVPDGTTFIAWLSFLKTLGESLTSGWSRYRQDLRNLPEQEGFPLNITWPTKPGE